MNIMESKAGKIMDYIRENFSLSCDAQRLLEAALFKTVDNRPSGSVGLLRAMLCTVGMNSDEINSIVHGEVPSRPMISVPVYARYDLGIKVWVDVPENATDAEIKEAAIEKILLDGDYDADEGFEQGAEDIHIYRIDYEGAQEVEDDE